jgi:hypothetical protein
VKDGHASLKDLLLMTDDEAREYSKRVVALLAAICPIREGEVSP